MFIFLITIVSASCPKYSCTSPSISMSPGACSTYKDSNYYISACEDTVSSYCDFIPNAESFCRIPDKTYSYPGEKCSENSDCLYSTLGCYKSVCNGVSRGKSCSDTHMCEPGLFCSSDHVCEELINIDSEGCVTDFECVNNGVCDGGVCVEFASIPANTTVRSCDYGINYACEYHTCTTGNSSYYCTSAMTKSKKNPLQCNQDSDCDSLQDTAFGNIIKGKCSCGHNVDGKRFCKVLPGDAEYLEFLNVSKKWHKSKAIQKCNSLRRRADKCIMDWYGYMSRVKLMYLTKLVWDYEKIQEIDFCVSNALHSDFIELEKQYNSIKG